MSGTRRWFSLLSACLMLCVLFIGCSGDDPAAPAATGSFAVVAGPENLATPWQLEGPSGLVAEGTGSRQIDGLAEGEYTLTWLAVDGWVRPWPATVVQSVGSDAVVVEGEYRENVPSTVVVQATPGDAAASWTLLGSEGFVASGTGDRTFDGVDAGHYTVTWFQPEGWLNTGRPVIDDEVFGDTLELAAAFTRDVAAPDGFEYVPAGTFTMGSPLEEWGRGYDEDAHEVTLSNAVFMSTREITRSQFLDMMIWAYTQDPPLVVIPEVYDTTFVDAEIAQIDTIYPPMDTLDVPAGQEPTLQLVNLFNMGLAYDHADTVPSQRLSMTGEGNEPIIGLNWYAAATYCDWLSLREGLTRAYDHTDWSCNGGDPYGAEGYRLPTEAEWERACRAGTTTAFSSGDIVNPICDDPNLNPVGWHCQQGLSAVGQLQANAWGLRDLHGNVWEWCQDWHDLYDAGPLTDPVVLTSPVADASMHSGRPPLLDGDMVDTEADKFLEPVRVIRGGDGTQFAYVLRSANRSAFDPWWTSNRIGFRPVMTAPAEE